MQRTYSAGSSGSSGTATIGRLSRTRARSTGLSSTKTRLSSPIFSCVGDASQILRLVVPVGDERGDVGALQHHLGVIAECGLGDHRVVLGADREDHAAVLSELRVALQREVCFADRAAFAEHDALEAVVTDDAAPQRVVEIEHQALPGPPASRSDERATSSP